MFVVGIDAHTRYLKVVVVSSTGERVLGPARVNANESTRLVTLLRVSPAPRVVETNSAWPWVHQVLQAAGGDVCARPRETPPGHCRGDVQERRHRRRVVARMDLAGCISIGACHAARAAGVGHADSASRHAGRRAHGPGQSRPDAPETHPRGLNPRARPVAHPGWLAVDAGPRPGLA